MPQLDGETGHEDETILIIPGLGTSVDFWQVVIPPIAKRYRTAHRNRRRTALPSAVSPRCPDRTGAPG